MNLVLFGELLQGSTVPFGIGIVPSRKLTDLSVVTAVRLEVYRGDGTTEEWSATVAAHSASRIDLTVVPDAEIADEKIGVRVVLSRAGQPDYECEAITLAVKPRRNI